MSRWRNDRNSFIKVRAHFCYCSQLWAPQSVIGNLFLVEKVQRRSTRLILKNSSNLSDKDRLIKLKLLLLNYTGLNIST